MPYVLLVPTTRPAKLVKWASNCPITVYRLPFTVYCLPLTAYHLRLERLQRFQRLQRLSTSLISTICRQRPLFLMSRTYLGEPIAGLPAARRQLFSCNFLQATYTIRPIRVDDPPITVHLNMDDFVQVRHYLGQFSLEIFGE